MGPGRHECHAVLGGLKASVGADIAFREDYKRLAAVEACQAVLDRAAVEPSASDRHDGKQPDQPSEDRPREQFRRGEEGTAARHSRPQHHRVDVASVVRGEDDRASSGEVPLARDGQSEPESENAAGEPPGRCVPDRHAHAPLHLTDYAHIVRISTVEIGFRNLFCCRFIEPWYG
jgi:hypothetical protein